MPAAAPVAGGDPLDPVAVGDQELVGAGHETWQVRDRADGCPRVDARQEAQLALVDVADAGQVALVEERVTDRDRRRP